MGVRDQSEPPFLALLSTKSGKFQPDGVKRYAISKRRMPDMQDQENQGKQLNCDEAPPVCQRCKKSGRTCYGMGAAASSVVHMENLYASGQEKRPRGPRSGPTEELMSGPGALVQLPLADLKTQAICYYLHHHLQPLRDAPNVSKGISDDVLPMWKSRAECPLLDLAMSSTALAIFSRTQQHPPAAVEASMNYQRLLKAAQKTFPSLNEGNIDACLLAIFFMSRYEDAVHRPGHLNPKTPFAATLQCFSHHDGALAILKIWKDHLSRSQPATDVIKHTRRSMIKSALMRNLALPEWMLDGTSFGEYGLELEYDCIIVRLANFRQRLSALLKDNETGSPRTPHELTSTAEELNRGARDIDKALADWTTRFPSAWGHQRHTLPDHSPWPIRDFYSQTVYSYSNPAYAAVWNRYYATRMLINSTRLKLIKFSRLRSAEFADEEQLKCLSHINTMADDLASSLPFCLHRFELEDNPNSSSDQKSIMLITNEHIKPYLADLTIWPLTIASSIADVDAKQKLWFRSELARLGRILGVRVLECAETDQWLEL